MAQRTMIAGFRPSRVKRVAILAFDGVVLGDLAGPLELFNRVRDEAGRRHYEVRLCSETAEVETEHVRLFVPKRLGATQNADLVIVPGSDPADRQATGPIIRAIRRAAERGATVASICSGAFILGAAGLLAGKRATTHWMAAAELARRYPNVEVDPNVLYVDNGNVLTSAGATAALDLCLHIVRRDFGAQVAANAARAAVMPPERTGGQAQFIVHETPMSTESLQPLLAWLERNLKRELTIPMIAHRASLSVRTLARRFQEQTGTTPAQWVAHARVRRAQRLLETTRMPMEEVAAEVGFGSASVLRERFGKVVGTSPQAYRAAFRGSE